jgi:hypothetical protein
VTSFTTGALCLSGITPEFVLALNLEEQSNSVDSARTNAEIQIRMVAGYRELLEKKEKLVAAACNHPNCLVLPFRLERIRLAA